MAGEHRDRSFEIIGTVFARVKIYKFTLSCSTDLWCLWPRKPGWAARETRVRGWLKEEGIAKLKEIRTLIYCVMDGHGKTGHNVSSA